MRGLIGASITTLDRALRSNLVVQLPETANKISKNNAPTKKPGKDGNQ